MIDITLKAGEKFPLSATARYFVVRSVGDNIFLTVRNNAEVQLQTSDVIDLLDTSEIALVNKSATPQAIKFQLSPFKIDLSGSNNVIRSIEEIVQVQFDEAFTVGAVTQSGGSPWNVTLTNEDDLKPANQNTHKPVKSCPAGVATLLIAAGSKKSVRLNIQADQVGGVYIGGSAAMVDEEGGYLDVGMVDYMETEGALYAFNPNGSAVKINILEMGRT